MSSGVNKTIRIIQEDGTTNICDVDLSAFSDIGDSESLSWEEEKFNNPQALDFSNVICYFSPFPNTAILDTIVVDGDKVVQDGNTISYIAAADCTEDLPEANEITVPTCD